MIINVYHAEHPGSDSIDYVARVDAPETLTVDEALEYAFRWTNNVDGSWSKGETFVFLGDTVENGDFNERVNCVANPHPQGYGTRSTSVGDWMVIGDVWYEVMPMGFRISNQAA
jgi:hypothetical protein